MSNFGHNLTFYYVEQRPSMLEHRVSYCCGGNASRSHSKKGESEGELDKENHKLMFFHNFVHMEGVSVDKKHVT